MNIFDIEGLTFAYPDSNDDSGTKYLPDAIKNINFTVGEGEFIVILGSSGCGKTTLLRQLKKCMAPHGRRSGTIKFMGEELQDVDDRKAAAQIGFVQQDVDAQLVTDKVWHELAFGLESLGYDSGYIRRRVAEISSFFGLSGIFHRKVSDLSGGQKQMVNLASIMALSPKVLLLDEPTSQLDPIAASEFIESLVRINRELGTTIIMTEHRLEEVLPVCSRAVVMESGGILSQGDVKSVASKLKDSVVEKGLYLSMPAAVQIYMGLGGSSTVPVTVAEGQRWLKKYDAAYRASGGIINEPECEYAKGAEPACIIDEVYFRYDSNSENVLKGLSLKINNNEILMINGSNGSGKSTLLSLICGINKPYRGKVTVTGGKSVSMLPQNPELLFTRRTVGDELVQAKDRKQLAEIISFCRLEGLLDRHPYDLSGGEKQRLALAIVLLGNPDILLMDEPTKGLDNEFKSEFNALLHELKDKGKTIVIVSHDIEFCAAAGDRIALLFDGETATVCGVREYMSGNHFFTTAAARISRGILKDAVTVADILSAYGAENKAKDDAGARRKSSTANYADKDIVDIVLSGERKADPLKWWQILVISITFPVIVLCFVISVFQSNLTELVQKGMAVTAKGGWYILIYAIMICAIAGLLLAVRPVTRKKNESIMMESAVHKIGKRTALSIAATTVIIPATIWFGCDMLGDRKYYFISLLIIIESMIPFFVSFEGRKPKIRDIVMLAVMCALAVTGRAAFFMLPNFSPTMAVVIISGVAFGCEGGFIVGAMSMFISNFMMGQGPWTPWQMFAMGLVGFLAGLFFARSGVRTKLMTRIGLCIFGGLVCIIVYGGIMNPASVVIWQGNINKSMLIATYITGFPFDLVHGTATVVFLWLLARPFLEKLDRVRIKYGVI